MWRTGTRLGPFTVLHAVGEPGVLPAPLVVQDSCHRLFSFLSRQSSDYQTSFCCVVWGKSASLCQFFLSNFQTFTNRYSKVNPWGHTSSWKKKYHVHFQSCLLTQWIKPKQNKDYFFVIREVTTLNFTLYHTKRNSFSFCLCPLHLPPLFLASSKCRPDIVSPFLLPCIIIPFQP